MYRVKTKFAFLPKEFPYRNMTACVFFKKYYVIQKYDYKDSTSIKHVWKYHSSWLTKKKAQIEIKRLCGT